MCVWRLRNHKEVETLCEELSGVYPAKTILSLLNHATAEPFSFLFVRLDAKTKRDMFWLRFESRLLPIESEEDGAVGDGERLASSSGAAQQLGESRQKSGGKAGRALGRPKPSKQAGVGA